jgi:hypothetical protein
MHRPSDLEVKLRQQDQLREAEYRRLVATARRSDRSNRIARALGLRALVAR